MPKEFVDYGLYYHSHCDNLYISFGSSKSDLTDAKKVMNRLFIFKDSETKEICEIRIEEYTKLRWRRDNRPFLWLEENLGIDADSLHKRAWSLIQGV